MANLNSENPHVGRKFQEFVQTILKEKYNTYFEQEAAIPIGRPPKEHKFDLANADRSIVAEYKCYTWTDSGECSERKVDGLGRGCILLWLSAFWDKEAALYEKSSVSWQAGTTG